MKWTELTGTRWPSYVNCSCTQSSPRHVYTYFVLTGYRDSELGRIVLELRSCDVNVPVGLRMFRNSVYSVLWFCVNSFGCQYRDKWSSRLHVWHTNRLRQQHRRTVPICRHSTRLWAWSSSSPLVFPYRTLAVPRTRTTFGDGSFCCRRTARVEQFTGYAIRQITSCGQFRQRLKTRLFRA